MSNGTPRDNKCHFSQLHPEECVVTCIQYIICRLTGIRADAREIRILLCGNDLVPVDGFLFGQALAALKAWDGGRRLHIQEVLTTGEPVMYLARELGLPVRVFHSEAADETLLETLLDGSLALTWVIIRRGESVQTHSVVVTGVERPDDRNAERVRYFEPMKGTLDSLSLAEFVRIWRPRGRAVIVCEGTRYSTPGGANRGSIAHRGRFRAQYRAHSHRSLLLPPLP